MTYNIHHGEGIDSIIDLSRIAQLIKDNEADLAAFQEVDKNVNRSHQLDIMKILSDSTGMFFSFGKNIDYQGGDYGNGILSKYKIEKEANRHYKMLREGEQRGLLQTFINIKGTKILFMNTHIDFRKDDAERLQNVDEIIEVLNSNKNLPVIICGDFNDEPGSRTHKKMKEYFIDVWEYLNEEETGFSYPAENPVKRIDYIFISKNSLEILKPVSIKVLKSDASDHLPVIAEFELIN